MVMALGSSEAKSSKQCKILKEKIVRKEKLILLLKELLQVKDKTTRENISQQLLTIRARSQEANASLKKEILSSCNSTKKIVELHDSYRSTIKELESSLEDRHGTIAHLEFQNKQLIGVQRQHEKTIATLKETIKNLEKKAGLFNFAFKSKKKKLKDKSSEDLSPTPASSISDNQEASKPSPQPNLISDGILTPASSVSSSIPVAGGPSSPGIRWLDLDSRSNSPTESLPELLNPSHDSVPSLLTPIQSAIEEPPTAGQSLPLLTECGDSEQPVAAVLCGRVDNVEITDHNQLNPESGDSDVQVSDPIKNLSDELVDGDRRLTPQPQCTSALSVFDLPLIESESESVCSNSREEHLVTKPQSEISFLNSISESLINGFELTDNSIDQYIASSDVAIKQPTSCDSENQVCHLTGDTRIRRELDRPEAEDCDKSENSSLPNLLDCVFGNGVSEIKASIETQSTSKSDNHTTFGDLCQDVPDTDLVENPITVDDLNKASRKQLEVSESPTTNVSDSIDICTEDDIVDITAQSTDLQASRIESPPNHSPTPYASNDCNPCVSSDDSSPEIDIGRELSFNISPTSSPLCTLNPSLTSSASRIDCNQETHSSSSEIEDTDSEHFPRLTKSNITRNKTSKRVTRQNPKKQMIKIDESLNKCTRQTRHSSTSKSELCTPEQQGHTSRINPSPSHDYVPPLLTPIQSDINEPPHAGQSLPHLSEFGNSEQPVAAVVSGRVDKVEITDHNQLNPESGDCNVQDSNKVKNLSDELVDGDRSNVMDRLSPKSQCTSGLSIFDLPLIESESEGVCSNSKEEPLVAKPQSEISLLNSCNESLINDFELTYNSEASIDQNFASSDFAVNQPNNCDSENQVCHLTGDTRIRRELDRPEAEDCDKSENSSLPNLLDCVIGNGVSEIMASLETQSTSKSDNHTTFGDLCQAVPDTDLVENPSTVDDLNTASRKQLEVSESPTTNVSDSIDICREDDIVDITAQSTDLQASRIESPPNHSPKRLINQSINQSTPYASNDCDPCVSSDDSSPEIDNIREVSSSISPTSSPLCTLNPSLTSSASRIDCNQETHSSSSEIEDTDSKYFPRLTRSNITRKKTSNRVTRQNPKKQMIKIEESLNKCTRQTRQSSTSKSELCTPKRRQSSRINPSLPSDHDSPLKGKSQPLNNSTQPISPTVESPSNSVEVSPIPEYQRSSNALSPDSISTGKKGKRKPNPKMCSQKLARSTTTRKSVITPGNCHEADPPVETSSSLTPTKSDDAIFRDLTSTVKSKQLTVKKRPSNETDDTLPDVEVSSSTPVQNKDSSISSESSELKSSLANSSNASADCIQDSNEENLSYSRHDIVASPDFAGFDDSGISQSTENDRAVPPQKSPMTDSSPSQIRETASCKNKLNLGAIHPNIPIFRNENNILCSATAAIQSCSTPFSKSFERSSTIFGAPNLPSFSNLKPEDIRSSIETNRSSGAFNPKDARYMHPQGKKVNDKAEAADVDTLQIGELSSSFNLLSINPNKKDDKTYDFFSKFKKNEVFNVDEYSTTFPFSRHQPLVFTDSRRPSDRGQFKDYRKGADKLDDSLDTNSEVTIEIKKEDSPFSFKLSVPAGKSLEPVFGSLCGMVREVQSKNAQFGSYHNLARGPPSNPGSCNSILRQFTGNTHPPSVASFQQPQHPVNRTSLDRSVCSKCNERSICAKHLFKTENQIVASCKWWDVTKRQNILRVVSPNFRSSSTFSTSTSLKSQSEPLKLHQSDVQLKASKLDSVFNDSDKEVNRSINGICTPIVPPVDSNSVRNYQNSTHPLTENAREFKSGLGSPNNHFSDPTARTESKCKSVVLEPSNSTNEKPKKVDTFTPINSSSSDVYRDSMVGEPVSGVTALLIEVPSEDSEGHSLPSIPPVLPVKTCSPTSVSPNATTSSSCGITDPPVVGNKRKIPHSPYKEASKSKKRCLPLSEEQKAEVFTRQSSSNRTGVGSPNQVYVGFMHPPPPKISQNLRKNRGETKPKKKVEPNATPTISPRKSSVETTATHSSGGSLKPAKAKQLTGKGADLKNVDKIQKCTQCQLVTTLCLCEIERIMAEVILLRFTPLSPIPDAPECADLDPVPCTDEESSYSGVLDNEKTSHFMKNVSELPCSSVHDTSAVKMCSSPGGTTSRVEKGASIDRIEQGVSSDEMSDSEELVENHAISPFMEEINVPSGRLMSDSTSVEMCSKQETSTCTMNADVENQPGVLKNDAKSPLLNESSDSLGGPVDKICLKASRNSVKRRRLGWKSSDGITAVNSSNVETPTPERGNTKNYMNLKKNPEMGKSRKVPNEMSAIMLEDQCDSSSMNRVTPESVTNVIPEKNEQNIKRRQRSCSSTPAGKQNNKSTALSSKTRTCRAEPTWPECSPEKNLGNNVVSEEYVDLMPESHLSSHSDRLKPHLTTLNPKKQTDEPIKNLEDQDRVNESQRDSKLTDSYRGEVQLSKAARSNPICERTSSREIDKSIDKLLESIGKVPGSRLTQSCTERPDHQKKPQLTSTKSPNPKEEASRTTFNPLSHLGKFFERSSSAVESSSPVCASGTNSSPKRLPSGSGEDSDSDMVVDYFSGSESEPKETPLKSLLKDDLEPSLSSAVEKHETTFNQTYTFLNSRPPSGFYVTAQQENECDGNNEPKNTISSSQSTTVLEKSSGMQLPKFYTAIDVESEVAPQQEAKPTQLIKIQTNNKISTKEIRPEDVVPCSINLLAFASFYDLHESEEPHKYPESYKKYQETIENGLNEFFRCPNLHDGLKKAVSTLNNMKPCHIGKALCAVAARTSPWFELYERDGITPFFSKMQKKAVVLVTALAKRREIISQKENYFNELLTEIEEFLIPSPMTPHFITTYEMINLSAIYSLICRTCGAGMRVQSFIYDLLYGRQISAFKIINQILLTIPQAIPLAKEEMGPLTYTIVYLIMKHGVYKNYTAKFLLKSGITPLRNRLFTKYHYSFPPDVTRDALMEKLMSNVMVKGCDKAIILLSKSQGYKWTFGVVQKYVFPVIDKWINAGEDEDYVVVFIKLLGLMSRCFAISVCDSFVTLSLNKFKLIIEKNPSLPVSEAVTEALVYFRRLNPEGVVTILANWTPHDYKITKSAVRTLKNITNSKPCSYWKQFMASV